MTHNPTAAHNDETPAADPQERLLVLIEAEWLTIAVDCVPLVRALVDTRQSGIGFLSVEARRVQNDLLRAERADRYANTRDGLTPSGPKPAPGSIPAFSLLAEAARLVGDVRQASTEPRSVRYLTALHRDLVDLHERMTRFVDGAQVRAMPDPCPWCDRHTLIADLTTGVITCLRDPDTGIYEWCICSDSYCPCQTASPAGHRHTWHRDHKHHKATSWYGLQRHTNARQDTTDD